MDEVKQPIEIPDYLEPIKAWRSWQVKDGLLRFGRVPKLHWKPYEVLEAKNVIKESMYGFYGPPTHICDGPSPCNAYHPGVTFGCGIYGWKNAAIHREVRMELAYWN